MSDRASPNPDPPTWPLARLVPAAEADSKGQKKSTTGGRTQPVLFYEQYDWVDVVADRALPASAKLLYRRLVRYGWNSGLLFVARGRLMTDTGLSRKQVKTAYGALRQEHLVRLTAQKRSHNDMHVLLDHPRRYTHYKVTVPDHLEPGWLPETRPQCRTKKDWVDLELYELNIRRRTYGYRR